MKHSLNLVVALFAEAQPLVKRFGLNRLPTFEGVSMYENGNLALTVSGIGKKAAARAVEKTQNQLGECVNAWLNVGVAGHGSLAIGQGFLANRILDQASGQSWYPMFVFERNCPTELLITVESVEVEYSRPAGYDMEAAGFFPAAIQYSTAELVQSYKIVSDNPEHPTENLTGKKISDFVESNLSEIERIVDSLSGLATDVASRKFSNEQLNHFLDRWKFTVTQQHQLKTLLMKTNTLSFNIHAESDLFRTCQDSRMVIQKLTDELNLHWLK